MRLKNFFALLLGVVLLFSCSKDDNENTTTGILSGLITDYSSGENLSDVRVMVFDATTNAPTNYTVVTDAEGYYSLELEPGVYYLKLSRQGYIDVPAPGISAVTVTVELDTEITNDYQMQQSEIVNSGYISGQVTSSGNSTAGVLVVASNGSAGFSSVSDADGNYFIYNVPAGTYSVNGYIAGYYSNEIDATVVANSESSGNNIELTSGATGSLSGSVTFLAVNNGEVDVTLTHPLTKETIPGLDTETSGGLYAMSNIPNGTYIARATYKNDGYVIDPDWILKNGEPAVTINDDALTLDFSVTGALEIVSPVSDVETAKPVEITETVPTFTWSAYSSINDYVIEVSDINGNVIWGGFDDSSGTIVKNIVIPKSELSITYNSDGNASSTLKQGSTYRWKVYASKDDAKEDVGWKLISVSEEQMGLFTIQ